MIRHDLSDICSSGAQQHEYDELKEDWAQREDHDILSCQEQAKLLEFLVSSQEKEGRIERLGATAEKHQAPELHCKPDMFGLFRFRFCDSFRQRQSIRGYTEHSVSPLWKAPKYKDLHHNGLVYC